MVKCKYFKNSKYSKLFIIFCTLSLAISFVSIASAQDNGSIDYNRYFEILDNPEVYISEPYNDDFEALWYSVFDLDNDGIYELMIASYPNYAGRAWHVFTILADNTPKYIGPMPLASEICHEGGLIHIDFHTGASYIMRTQLIDGAIVSYYLIMVQSSLTYGDPIIYGDIDNGVTPEAAMSFLESYYPGIEIYIPASDFYDEEDLQGYVINYNELTHFDSLPTSEMDDMSLLLSVVENKEYTAVTASPTSSAVYINGDEIAFNAFNIDDYNYFKLRDIAYVLNGTEKQFSIEWDDALNKISLISGRQYIAVGGEMSMSINSDSISIKQAQPTDSIMVLDGREISLIAYNIDGYNYFRLRDIGEEINFGVDWDEADDSIRIDTKIDYSG